MLQKILPSLYGLDFPFTKWVKKEPHFLINEKTNHQQQPTTGREKEKKLPPTNKYVCLLM